MGVLDDPAWDPQKPSVSQGATVADDPEWSPGGKTAPTQSVADDPDLGDLRKKRSDEASEAHLRAASESERQAQANSLTGRVGAYLNGAAESLGNAYIDSSKYTTASSRPQSPAPEVQPVSTAQQRFALQQRAEQPTHRVKNPAPDRPIVPDSEKDEIDHQRKILFGKDLDWGKLRDSDYKDYVKKTTKVIDAANAARADRREGGKIANPVIRDIATYGEASRMGVPVTYKYQNSETGEGSDERPVKPIDPRVGGVPYPEAVAFYEKKKAEYDKWVDGNKPKAISDVESLVSEAVRGESRDKAREDRGIAGRAAYAAKSAIVSAKSTATTDLYEGLSIMAHTAENAIRSMVGADRVSYDKNNDLIYILLDKGLGNSEQRAGLASDPLSGGWEDTLANGVGSTIGFASSGWLASGFKYGSFLAPAITGAATQTQSVYNEAIQYGASQEDAEKVVLLATLAGATEALPITRMFGRFDKAYDIAKGADRATKGAFFRTIISHGIGEGFEESLQEAVQTGISNIAIAKYIDENRGVFDGMLEGAEVGGSVGTMMGVLFSAAGFRHANFSTPEGRQEAFDYAADLAQKPEPKTAGDGTTPPPPTPSTAHKPADTPSTPDNAPPEPPSPATDSEPAPAPAPPSPTEEAQPAPEAIGTTQTDPTAHTDATAPDPAESQSTPDGDQVDRRASMMSMLADRVKQQEQGDAAQAAPAESRGEPEAEPDVTKPLPTKIRAEETSQPAKDVAKPRTSPTKSEGKAQPAPAVDDVAEFDPSLQKYDVYKIKTNLGDRYAVRRNMDNDSGFGDSIHESPEQARKEASDDKRLDDANAEFYAKQAAKQKVKDDAEAAAKSDREDIDGFAADRTAMQRGKVVKNLNGKVRIDGKPDTIRNHVRAMVEAGDVELEATEEDIIKPMSRLRSNRADNREQEAHEKKIKDRGTKTVYRINGRNLGKTAYEYAQHLVAGQGAKSDTLTPDSPSKVTEPAPKKVAAAPEPGTGKQPWEMSQGEFVARQKASALRGANKKSFASRSASSMRGWEGNQGIAHRAAVEQAIARGDIDSHPDYPELTKKSPPAATKKEIRKQVRDDFHKMLVDKSGKRYADKYSNETSRLYRDLPVSEEWIEDRVTGFVTRSKGTDQYTLHLIAGTDERVWRIASTIDVSDQFTKNSALKKGAVSPPAAQATASVKTPKAAGQEDLSGPATKAQLARMKKAGLKPKKSTTKAQAVAALESVDAASPEAPVSPRGESKKKPWQQTKEEFQRGKTGVDAIAIGIAAHANHVKNAVLSGKPVPEKVLRQYSRNQWAKNALALVKPENKGTIQATEDSHEDKTLQERVQHADQRRRENVAGQAPATGRGREKASADAGPASDAGQAGQDAAKPRRRRTPRKPGTRKPTKAEYQRKLIASARSDLGLDAYESSEDIDNRHSGDAQHFRFDTNFSGKIPTGLREALEGQPHLLGMLRSHRAGGMGEDAMGAMGGESAYIKALEQMNQSELSRATELAMGNADQSPAAFYAAYLLDRWPRAKRKGRTKEEAERLRRETGKKYKAIVQEDGPDIQRVPADTLKAGDTFATFDDVYTVAEEHGSRILLDEDGYPVAWVDGLDEVLIDTDSLKKAADQAPATPGLTDQQRADTMTPDQWDELEKTDPDAFERMTMLKPIDEIANEDFDVAVDFSPDSGKTTGRQMGLTGVGPEGAFDGGATGASTGALFETEPSKSKADESDEAFRASQTKKDSETAEMFEGKEPPPPSVVAEPAPKPKPQTPAGEGEKSVADSRSRAAKAYGVPDSAISDIDKKIVSGELPENALTEYDTPEIVQAREKSQANNPTTDLIAADSDASIREKRIKLHAQIINEIETLPLISPDSMSLGKGGGVPISGVGQDRRAFVVLGPPGAGKSKIADPLAEQERARVIDADMAKAKLPEFDGGIGAAMVHKESSNIVEDTGGLIDLAVGRGDNMVLPMIGKNPKKIENLISSLHKMGYEIDLVLIHIPAQEVGKRLASRFTETGRFVDPAYGLYGVANSPMETYTKLKGSPHVRSQTHYSNHVPRGSDLRVIEGPPVLQQDQGGVGQVGGSVLGRPATPVRPPGGNQPKSLTDGLLAKADEYAQKRKNLGLKGKDRRSRGGSIIGPSLAYMSGEIALRATAAGITKGKALTAFVTRHINERAPEYKDHINKVLGKVRRIIKESFDDNGRVDADRFESEIALLERELTPTNTAGKTVKQAEDVEPPPEVADDPNPKKTPAGRTRNPPPYPRVESGAGAFSARHADIDADRQERGLPRVPSPERRTWSEAMDEAEHMGLPGKAMQTAVAIIENPKPLNDIETAGLLMRRVQVQKEYDRLNKDSQETTDPADLKFRAAEMAQLEDEFDTLTKAMRISGSEKGRALAAQKATINTAMDLVSVLNRAKVKKGKPLTTKERTQLEALTRKHEELEERYSQMEDRMAILVSQLATRGGPVTRRSRMTMAEVETETMVHGSRVAALLKAGCN